VLFCWLKNIYAKLRKCNHPYGSNSIGYILYLGRGTYGLRGNLGHEDWKGCQWACCEVRLQIVFFYKAVYTYHQVDQQEDSHGNRDIGYSWHVLRRSGEINLVGDQLIAPNSINRISTRFSRIIYICLFTRTNILHKLLVANRIGYRMTLNHHQ